MPVATTPSRRLLYSEMHLSDALQAFDWSSDAQDVPAEWDTPSQEQTAEDSTEAPTTSMYAWLHPKPKPDLRLKKDAPVAAPTPVKQSPKHADKSARLPQKAESSSKKPKKSASTVMAKQATKHADTPPKSVAITQVYAHAQKVATASAHGETGELRLRNVPRAIIDALLYQAQAQQMTLPAYIIALLQVHAETL